MDTFHLRLAYIQTVGKKKEIGGVCLSKKLSDELVKTVLEEPSRYGWVDEYKRLNLDTMKIVAYTGCSTSTAREVKARAALELERRATETAKSVSV